MIACDGAAPRRRWRTSIVRPLSTMIAHDVTDISARITSSVWPTWIVRSRNACPGHAHSSTPEASRSTARKILSPRRVGTIPLSTTFPMHATSSPTRARASGLTEEASR